MKAQLVLSSLPLIFLASCAAHDVQEENHYAVEQAAPPEAAPAANYAKPGFFTEVVDGRLWIFRSDCEELTQYQTIGEPAKHVIQPGAGPDGMTVKAPDKETIQSYMACAPGYTTFVVDSRIWVFPNGDAGIEEFQTMGEPAKHVIRIGVGPMGMTVKGPDNETIDAYLRTLRG